MLTQSPLALPRIHSLYSELPPNSRRAANLPFFVPRAHPSLASTSVPVSPTCAPNSGSASGAPPFMPRRSTALRRNAISFHPSVENASVRSSSPLAAPVAPPALPRTPSPRPALLLTSGYTSEPKPISHSPPLVVSLAPARVPRSQREYQAKMVANLLLNRGGRARPMRCARRGSFMRAGYQPSSLSTCIIPADDNASEHAASDCQGELA
jgi:hypothetical protein